jgi:hypothetical protein
MPLVQIPINEKKLRKRHTILNRRLGSNPR